MLCQNWFMKSNFIMFSDYGDYQLFYDAKSGNIYEVIDNIIDEADTTIREYSPENPNYSKLYAAYKSYLNTSKNRLE